MKIHAKLNSKIVDQDNHAHLGLLITNYRHVAWTEELELDVDYVVEIKKAKSKRSLNQNALFWKLLHELEKQSNIDVMIWYANVLEETNCKFTHIMGIDGIEKELLGAFRAVRKLGQREVNGKEVMVYRCYYGSSKYTIKEMNELLETVMRYCAEYDIETELMNYE